MKKVFCIAKLLVFIGAVEWGLIGLFRWSALGELFGIFGDSDFMFFLLRLIHIAVGVSGVLLLLCHLGKCGKGSCETPAAPAAPPAE